MHSTVAHALVVGVLLVPLAIAECGRGEVLHVASLTTNGAVLRCARPPREAFGDEEYNKNELCGEVEDASDGMCYDEGGFLTSLAEDLDTGKRCCRLKEDQRRRETCSMSVVEPQELDLLRKLKRRYKALLKRRSPARAKVLQQIRSLQRTTKASPITVVSKKKRVLATRRAALRDLRQRRLRAQRRRKIAASARRRQAAKRLANLNRRRSSTSQRRRSLGQGRNVAQGRRGQRRHQRSTLPRSTVTDEWVESGQSQRLHRGRAQHRGSPIRTAFKQSRARKASFKRSRGDDFVGVLKSAEPLDGGQVQLVYCKFQRGVLEPEVNYEAAITDDACFPNDATVKTASGRKAMRDLVIGDSVLSLTSDSRLAFSPIRWFHHSDAKTSAVYLRLATSSGAELLVSPRHLLPYAPAPCEQAAVPKTLTPLMRFAERVEEGDCLFVQDGEGRLRVSAVTKVTETRRVGLWAPVPASGTIIVDGVVASAYSTIERHQLLHQVHGVLGGLSGWLGGWLVEDSGDVPPLFDALLSLVKIAFPISLF